MLMRRYRHRVSKDVDMFIEDPRFVAALSPRLNDVAEQKTSECVEQAGFVKPYFEDGEVDFIVALPLTHPAASSEETFGCVMSVETDAEIIANELEHRGDVLRARNFFDLARVIAERTGTSERS